MMDSAFWPSAAGTLAYMSAQFASDMLLHRGSLHSTNSTYLPVRIGAKRANETSTVSSLTPGRIDRLHRATR